MPAALTPDEFGQISKQKCLHCKNRFTRNQYANGEWESPCLFRKRKFCSQFCNWQYLKDHPPVKPKDYGLRECVICGVSFGRWPGERGVNFLKRKTCGSANCTQAIRTETIALARKAQKAKRSA